MDRSFQLQLKKQKRFLSLLLDLKFIFFSKDAKSSDINEWGWITIAWECLDLASFILSELIYTILNYLSADNSGFEVSCFKYIACINEYKLKSPIIFCFLYNCDLFEKSENWKLIWQSFNKGWYHVKYFFWMTVFRDTVKLLTNLLLNTFDLLKSTINVAVIYHL